MPHMRPSRDPEIKALIVKTLAIATGKVRDDQDALPAVSMAEALLRFEEGGPDPDLDAVREFIAEESWEGMPA